MTKIFYTEKIGEDDDSLMLYRFTETDTELKSEFLNGDVWIQDNSLIEILRDSYSSQYKEIDSEKALKIAKKTGGSI